YLMQAGYPIDLVFDLTLDAINGIQGRTISGPQVRPASPEYQRIVQAMRKGQASGQVGMRIEVGKDKKESLVMFIRDPDLDPALPRAVPAGLREAERLWGMPPAEGKFRVSWGAAGGGPGGVRWPPRPLSGA